MNQMHKLSDRQYTWACLSARAKRYQWKDCEELVITKGWLGGKKTTASIDPEKVVIKLFENGAPANILQGKIINCIHHLRSRVRQKWALNFERKLPLQSIYDFRNKR